MTIGRRTAVLAACLAGVVTLSACAPDAPPRPSDYIGQTLQAASQHLNAPNVIDLSPKIVAKPATFNGASDPSAWIVVAGCYASNPQKTSTVGVLATTTLTDAIRAAAKKGDYNKYLVCKPYK